jgi:hypothetical protein
MGVRRVAADRVRCGKCAMTLAALWHSAQAHIENTFDSRALEPALR